MKKLLFVFILICLAISLFSADKDFVIENYTLVKYTGTSKYVSLPSGIRKIGKEAFKDTSVSSVSCTYTNLETIEDKAFYNCSNLSSIDLPYSLREIGSYAFYNCSWLKRISIPQNIYRVGYNAFAYSGVQELTFKMNTYDTVNSCQNKTRYGFEGMNNLQYILYEFAYNKILVYEKRTGKYYWKK